MDSDHAISKRSERSGKVFRIQIGSKEMAEDLFHLGLSVQKVRRIVLPTAPEKFLGDFVRGYFDGDGNLGDL